MIDVDLPKVTRYQIMEAAMGVTWVNLGDGGTLYDHNGDAILVASGLVLPLDELLEELFDDLLPPL